MSRHASVSDHFAAVPMFAACTKKELQAVARLSTEREVPAGKELTREGQPGREFVIVLEGTAVATRRGRKLATLGPGDYFGEIALLDPGERTATVTADTPMTLAVVTWGEFDQMLVDVPALGHKIMQGLARQIRELSSGEIV